MNTTRYIPFQIPLLTAHLSFLFFFSDNIMADVASKQQTTALFLSTSHTHKKTHRTKKTDNPDAKPVPENNQFSFSCSFFYTF
jgi:hypothetical protein